jgi:hypothetical protein
MARIFIDGGESGSVDLWDSGSPPTINSNLTYVFDGSYSLNGNNGTKSDFSFSEIYLSVRDYLTWGDAAVNLWQFTISGTVVATLSRNAGGYLEVYSGTIYGTKLATGTTLYAINQYHLLEIYYKAHDTSGRWTIKIDGNPAADIDYTGDTTSGGTTIMGIVLPYPNYFDNIVMDDTTWPGDTRIQAILPSGVGTTTQWTPSTGDNYACVDEVPYSDTDYISTNTTNQTDTYAFGNLTGTIGAVKCVQVQARCSKEGDPTPTKIAMVTRVSGADYSSADLTPTTSKKSLSAIWNTNPNTAAAWLEAGVNGAEFGVKSKA